MGLNSLLSVRLLHSSLLLQSIHLDQHCASHLQKHPWEEV